MSLVGGVTECRIGIDDATSSWVEDLLDPAFEEGRQPEGQRQGRIKPSPFDGDDGLAGDAERVGKSLL